MKRALLLIVFLAGPAAGQNLIPNATFDTDVNGWIAYPGGFAGAVEWSAVQGQPPGALRLVGEDDATIPVLCFPVVDGFSLFRADVYMDTSGEFILCSLNYAMYDSFDCSDSPAFWVDDGSGTAFPLVTAPHEWQTLELPFKGDLRDVNIHSIRPIMGKLGDIDSDDACVMDNVYWEIIPRVPAPIPAVNPAGLVLLAALTAGAAFVVLRRR